MIKNYQILHCHVCGEAPRDGESLYMVKAKEGETAKYICKRCAGKGKDGE